MALNSVVYISVFVLSCLAHADAEMVFAPYKPKPVLEVCGQYQVEDFSDSVIYSVIDYHSFPPMMTTYNISNFDAPIIKRMVVGHCYCVRGPTSADPNFSGDSMYQRMIIQEVVAGPFPECKSITIR